MSAFHFSVLFLFLSSIAAAGEFSFERCGEKVTAAGLILPGDVIAVELNDELRFRQSMLAAAHLRVESEYQNYVKVHDWVLAYGEDSAVDSRARAMDKAITKSFANLHGDELAQAKLKYFGIYFPASGKRVKALARALLIQCYLARFEELMKEKLMLRVSVDSPILTASPDIISEVAAHVSDEMANPKKIEDKFLTILPKMPLRTKGVLTDENNSVEGAYLRADALALEAAKAKTEALVLDPGVPDVVREFGKWYLLEVSLRQPAAIHPLLVDWAASVEGFLTPDESP